MREIPPDAEGGHQLSPVLFVALKVYMKDGRLALLAVWGALVLSPVVLQQLATGGDLLANVIYVLVFTLLLTSVTAKRDVSVWVKIRAWTCPNFSTALGTIVLNLYTFMVLLFLPQRS